MTDTKAQRIVGAFNSRNGLSATVWKVLEHPCNRGDDGGGDGDSDGDGHVIIDASAQL